VRAYTRTFSSPELAVEARVRIESDPVLQITHSERDALQLLAQGAPTRQIGAALGLSHADIDPFLSALFTRLGVTSRAGAVLVASRRGLLVPSSNGAATDASATQPDEET
jgi:DNA-binding NarL/FixJ family response regulator